MSDNTQWQPPGGADAPTTPPTAFPPPVPPVASPPPPVATPFPAPGAAPVGPAPFGPGVGAPPPGAPGWTPPPKPGLIPLRPLTFGTLLGASFQVLRRNPRPMFGFSLLLTGLVFLVTLLGVGLLTFWSLSRVASAVGPDAETVAIGTAAGAILSTLIPVALSIVVLAILQGIVVLEVARGTLGEKLTLRGLWRAARGRIGALIGWALLATVVSVVAVTIIVIVITLIIAFGGDAGLGIGIALAVLTALGSVVVGAWLWTRLCLVPSVLVLERLPLRHAIRRSWALTIGFFWKTLGIQLLVAFILSAVSYVISLPISIVLVLGVGLFNPNGDTTAATVAIVVGYVLTIAVSVVFGAITAVVQSAVTGLIYIDIRMRKEGLDIELSRFVEARQAGDTSVPDPYLLRQQPVPAA